MKSVDRKRICTNCDGQISYEAKECPYCGATLKSATTITSPFSNTKVFQESGASLYPPAYTPAAVKKPLPPVETKNYLDEAVEKTHAASLEKPEKNVWPLFSFSLGALLLTLGLMFFFFSTEGKLHLEWDTEYWFVYCLAALPLLFFGFKKISK